jgi:hypothetical protein
MLLEDIGQPLSTAKRVKNSRWEMPKGYWAASGKFLKGIGKPLGMPKYMQPANGRGGRISQRLLAKTWQFQSLFAEGPCFCSLLLKVEGAVKNIKNAQRLFSYFCSF